MKNYSNVSTTLVVDIAPLWEDQFTGISNVVCELAARFLHRRSELFNFKFSAFDRVIEHSVVADCVLNRNGRSLRAYIDSGIAVSIEDDNSIELSRDYCLYLHVKPPFKKFHKEAHLYYDFSFLSMPESHARETVDFHTNNIIDQVDSTDIFFCISQSTSLDLQWYFDVPENRICVSYLGHNADTVYASQFASTMGSRDVEPFILILGTIEPRKNIALVLRWLSEYPCILDRYRFVFCGREGWGPRFSELIQLFDLQRFVDSGRILHLGYVTETQKAALISFSYGMIYPSLFEGFGLPVLESMAMGAPIIASCTTSIPEVMGQDGFYFDPYSVDSLDTAFWRLVSEKNAGLIDRRLALLRKRASTFSYDNTFETIMQNLENILKKESDK